MAQVTALQEMMARWQYDNFPGTEPWELILGIQEEVGELSHAYLKRHQGIRKNEDHDEAIQDAVGDIFIYLANFCTISHLDLEACIVKAWTEVRQRDWRKERGLA